MYHKGSILSTDRNCLQYLLAQASGRMQQTDRNLILLALQNSSKSICID